MMQPKVNWDGQSKHARGAVDASDLGFSRGKWPAILVALSPFGHLMTFNLSRFEYDSENEVQAACYTHEWYTVKVLND